MDISTYTDQILAILTVLSTVLTLIFTVYKSRNSLKQENIEVRRSENNLGIEAAERLNTVSLSIATTLDKQLQKCEERRLDLEKSVQESSLELTNLKIKIKKLVFPVREILDQHEILAKKCGQENCPGIPVINKMLLDLITEIEKEVDK